MMSLAAFALKMVIVLALTPRLYSRCPQPLAAFLGAWTIVTGASFAAILVLSAGKLLTPTALWLILGAGGVFAAVLLRHRLNIPPFLRDGAMPLIFFAVFWLGFAARALVFQDFTWDAQTYGLVRIALWMNYTTVLVHMPTPLINVFVNEWNGELLGLYYGLATGDLQGPVFANVEVLLITFLACAWVAHSIGAGWKWAFAVAALAALCPAGLGLATTVKGDLLAVGAFVMAVGWALALRARPDWLALALFGASLALAVGAKVTAFPLAAVVGVVVLISVSRKALLSAKAACLGGLLASAFLSRFIVNYVVYGDFIHRHPADWVGSKGETLRNNLEMIWSRLFEFSMHEATGSQLGWILAGGLGVTGYAAAFALAGVLAFKRPLPLALLGALVVGLAVSCMIIPDRWWGFRYFLPGVVAAAVIILAAIQLHGPPALVAALAGAAMNISYLTWPGDLNGNGSFVRAVREQIGKKPIEKTFLAEPERGTKVGYDFLSLDRDDALTIVLYQSPDRSALPFMGSYAQHRVIMTRTPWQVPVLLNPHKADMAVITRWPNHPNYPNKGVPENLREAVSKVGYTWVVENNWVGIAVRSDRAEARRSIRDLAGPTPEALTWNDGAYNVETYRGLSFRWVRARATLSMPLTRGAVCVVLSVFGTGRIEPEQIVRVEGAAVEPAEFNIAGTTISSPKTVRLAVRASGDVARLLLISTMAETRFAGDPRLIAFGVALPIALEPVDRCSN